jgi:hypothetical protein
MGEEIKAALAAIAAGADRATVAARFKERTGADLDVAQSNLSPKVGGALDFLSSMLLPAASKIGFMPGVAEEELGELRAREPAATRVGGMALPIASAVLAPGAAAGAVRNVSAASKAPGMLLNARLLGKATTPSPAKGALMQVLRNKVFRGVGYGTGAAGGARLGWEAIGKLFKGDR